MKKIFILLCVPFILLSQPKLSNIRLGDSSPSVVKKMELQGIKKEKASKDNLRFSGGTFSGFKINSWEFDFCNDKLYSISIEFSQSSNKNDLFLKLDELFSNHTGVYKYEDYYLKPDLYVEKMTWPFKKNNRNAEAILRYEGNKISLCLIDFAASNKANKLSTQK